MRGIYVYLVLILLAALAGCANVDAQLRAGVIEANTGLRQTAAAFRVYRENVSPRSGLSPEDAAKVVALGLELEANLEQATETLDAAVALAEEAK